MAERQSNDPRSASTIEDVVSDLRLKLPDPRDSSQNPDYNYDNKLEKISHWAKEQEKEKDKAEHIPVGDEDKTFKDTIGKIKTLAPSLLDGISTCGELLEGFGIPGGFIVKTVGKFGKIAFELQHPSVTDKVTEVSPDKFDQNKSVNKINDKVDQLAKSVDTIKDTVGDLRLELSDWVKVQKKKEKEKEQQILLEDVSKVLITTVNSIEKLRSGDPLEIMRGVLDIISSAAHPISNSYGPIIGLVCGVVSAILTESKPQQPSVVDQLANVVHNELIRFNRRLQDQTYNGLKRRVSDQKSQLRTMKPGEKLDDPNLWNDYVQFMGELSNRFESPLPFKCKANLISDPDVADFVTAMVTYCEAYCCFMALLLAAKGKFAELGSANKEAEGAVDRKISCQMEDVRKKLSFLSEERYLTFLGRLPYEDGKLTKIVVLSRITRSKSVVEAVRRSLDLTPMQHLDTVEVAATKVARQSVKGKVQRHLVLPREEALVLIRRYRVRYHLDCNTWFVQFINETPLPMKIVSGRVGSEKSNLEFVQDVQPHTSYCIPCHPLTSPSTGGYITLYLDGKLPNSDPKQPVEKSKVLEFALSYGCKINIQDKTNEEFTRGLDTYNKMTSGETKTLYWFENGMHFMARGEIVPFGEKKTLYYGEDFVWRFLVQNYDPCSEQDLIKPAIQGSSPRTEQQSKPGFLWSLFSS